MTRDQHEAATDSSEVAEGTTERGSFDVTIDEGFASNQGVRVRRRISTGTLIMGGVLAIAATSLWSMRAIDRAAAVAPKGSKEVEDLVNKALSDKGSGTVETDASRLLEPTEATQNLQVPLAELSKNPFVLWAPPIPPGGGGGGTVPTEPTVDVLAERIAEWERNVDSAAAAIKVQSTMSGSGPLGATGIANINGHMMRISDVFGVDNSDIEFSIERIERDALTVRAYNGEFKRERLVTVKVNRKW